MKFFLSVVLLFSPLISGAEEHCHVHGIDAPVGVMGAHVHEQGHWMFGYKYMFERSEGLREGSRSLSENAALKSVSPGGDQYTSVPLRMDMHMHMFELMAAPTDWLTLMVMAHYMEMDMEMFGSAHRAHHGSHVGHDGHGSRPMQRMSHSVRGWSDTSITGLIPLFKNGFHSVHAGLGVSLPTGDVGVKGHGGNFTHYGMQLGSGTWDLLPGLTYSGSSGAWGWGVQYGAVIRLEDENKSGFRFGDVHRVTAWNSLQITDWLTLSARVAYRHEGEVRGHYNGPHAHGAPPDFQQNYGGQHVDAGGGLSIRGTSGWTRHHRLGVEVLTPVWQEVNGIQLERDLVIYAGWEWTF